MADAPGWVVSTTEAVDRASDAEKARRDSEDLNTARDNLDVRADELDVLVNAATVGRGVWWPGIDAPPELWRDVRSARENLGRREVERVWSNLAPYALRVRREALDAWQARVAARIGDVEELQQLAEALRNVVALEQVAANLDRALDDIAGLRIKLPDPDAVSQLERVVELIDGLRDRLPHAVRDFFSAATSGGASLGQVNREVLAWLSANGAVDVFRVVAGRPTGAGRG